MQAEVPDLRPSSYVIAMHHDIGTLFPGLFPDGTEPPPTTHVPAGSHICMEGDRCGFIPLVVEGTARVYKMAENGREITLYRIEPGGSCVVTASCIIGERDFPAFAVAETDVVALVIDADRFQSLTRTSEAWHGYVYGLLSRKLADVIELVEEVAFHRVDARLLDYLRAEAVEGRVHRTHDAMAADLGTSREVVSRLLRDLEEQGVLRRERGHVHLAGA